MSPAHEKTLLQSLQGFNSVQFLQPISLLAFAAFGLGNFAFSLLFLAAAALAVAMAFFLLSTGGHGFGLAGLAWASLGFGASGNDFRLSFRAASSGLLAAAARASFTISLFSLQQEAAFSLQQLAPASVLTISVLSAQQLPVETISLPDSLQQDLPSTEVKPAGVKLSELLLFGFEPLKK